MKKIIVVFHLAFSFGLTYSQGFVASSPNQIVAVNSTYTPTPILFGLGTASPTSVLHTNGTLRFENLQQQTFPRVLATDVNGNVAWRDESTLIANNAWLLNGNTNTNPVNNFLGTTDNNRLVFRTNNTERATIGTNGYWGVNTNNPQTYGHIRGTNQPNWGVFAVQDAVNSGTNGAAFVTFFGSDNNRLGIMGPSFSNFVIQNEVPFFDRAVHIAPNNGYVIINGGSSFSNDRRSRLQVKGRCAIDSSTYINVTAAARNQNAILHTNGTLQFDNLPTGRGNILVRDAANIVRVATLTAARLEEMDEAVTTMQSQIADLQSLITTLQEQINKCCSNSEIKASQELKTKATNFDIVLHQNKPNPFNSKTVLDFTIPSLITNKCVLKIYNLVGTEV